MIAAVLFHLPVYAAVTFVWDTGLHFVHLYAALFLVELGIMWGVSRALPPASAPTPQPPAQAPAPVDMTPWRWTRLTCVLLILAAVAVYWLFSPLGLAGC